jgi:hypothetical protein
MPGLVPGIHAFLGTVAEQSVDGRDKPGDDGREWTPRATPTPPARPTPPSYDRNSDQAASGGFGFTERGAGGT